MINQRSLDKYLAALEAKREALQKELIEKELIEVDEQIQNLKIMIDAFKRIENQAIINAAYDLGVFVRNSNEEKH